MYFEGTSDIKGDATAFTDYGVLGDKDNGIEVNLGNVISIYENLNMFVELGYVQVNLDNEPANFEDNAWKGYVGFTYSF